jgi:hypothetical protein
MWYNGTSLSEKARRAMENEKVTIVSHISGFIHTLYKEATIDRDAYAFFSVKLKQFLVTELTSLIFVNFLRFKSKYKTLFQYRCDCSGTVRYISLEKMFEYEHTSKFSVSSETRGSLVKEIEGDDFHLSPIQWKIMLNDIETILDKHSGKSLKEIENEFIKKTGTDYEEIIQEMFKELNDFISIDPKIPDPEKNYTVTDRLEITVENSREEIINLITGQQENSETAQLALYVYRDMDKIDWRPFIKAAVERNPVSFTDLNEKNNYEVYSILKELPIESIYNGNRLALPDEVWNFRRGDGIEKAFLLAGFLLHNDKSSNVSIEIDNNKVLLSSEGHEFHFTSHKNLKKSIRIKGTDYRIV